MPEKKNFWGSLKLLPKRGQKGKDRLRIGLLNRDLKRSWEKDDRDVFHQVGWIATRIRCSILQMTRLTYAEETGFNWRTIANLDDGIADQYMYSRNLPHWRRLISAQENQETINLLDEGEEKLLTLLVQHFQMHTVRLLWRCLLKVGPEGFEEETGIHRNTILKREEIGSVGTFRELLMVLERLNLLGGEFLSTEAKKRDEREHKKRLWSHPRVREARQVWMEDAVIQRGKALLPGELLMMIDFAGYPLDDNSLRERFGVKQRHARELSRGHRIPADCVHAILSLLTREQRIPRDAAQDLLRRWKNEEAQHSLKESQSFGSQVESLLCEQELNNTLVARLLCVAQHRDTLNTRKPSYPVREALRQGVSSPLAPFATLAYLAAQSPDNLDALLSKKRNEMEREHAGRNSKLHPLYRERQLWGVSYEEIPHTKEQVQRLERQRPTDIDPDDLADVIQEVGNAKAQRGLERWLGYHAPQTVRDAATFLGEKIGISVLAAKSGIAWTSLKEVAGGTRVLPLPIMRSIVENGKALLTPSLVMDWRFEYARKMEDSCDHDLARVLSTFIGSEARSNKEFWKQKGMNVDAAQHFFQNIHGNTSPESLNIFLSNAGLSKKATERIFIESVLEAGSIVEALDLWADRLQKLGRKDLIEGLGELRVTLTEEEKEPLSLEELFERKCVVQRCMKGKQRNKRLPFLEQEERVLRTLQVLPGVTREELLREDA